VNRKPSAQEEAEKSSGLKGEAMEAFRASGGYPEQDRTNRHTLASAVVHVVKKGVRGEMEIDMDGRAKGECTVLSKCTQNLPTEEEWGGMFEREEPATWPDPMKYEFKGVKGE